jgi:hypothetical protein
VAWTIFGAAPLTLRVGISVVSSQWSVVSCLGGASDGAGLSGFHTWGSQLSVVSGQLLERGPIGRGWWVRTPNHGVGLRPSSIKVSPQSGAQRNENRRRCRTIGEPGVYTTGLHDVAPFRDSED